MTQGGAGGQNLAVGDALAMTSLSSRQDLPPRVREILSGVLARFWHDLERPVTTSLDEFERHLVQQANKPRVGEAGSRCLESIRRMKPTRADFAPRFMLALEDDLAQFDHRGDPQSVVRKIEPVSNAWQDLSLVGSSELDESLTLREMASRSELRHSVALFELGYRFAVLAGRPAFDAESVPFGPARIAASLRYAVAALDLPLDHRITFYQTFERVTMAGLGAVYAAANAWLAEQRILRHLQLATMQKQRTAPPSPAEAARAAATRDAAPPRSRGSDPRSIDVGGFGLAAFEVAGAGQDRPAAPPAARRDPAAPRERDRGGSDAEGERFRALRAALAERHRRLGTTQPARTPDAFEPAPRDLQVALGTLQVRSPPTIMLGGKVVQRTMAQLRQDLLNQLRHVTPPGQMPRLADEDADTVDLVGLLFDQLQQATRADGRTPSLLTRLQVPILRAALRDKRFFFKPDYAPRLFLNGVAEAGNDWLDEGGENDPALLERLQRAIERINSEFDTDVRVFEQVHEELQTFVGALARRAEVAERRLAEACRGREKLALARETATRAIGLRLAAARPPRLLRTLLEQPWTDVLALTVLRQGEKSEAYRRQIAVADQLIAVGGAMSGMLDKPLAAQWREEIETGLAQVGYHPDEIQAVVSRLFTPEQAVDDDHAISQTDLAMRMKSRMRLGEANGDEPPSPEPTTALSGVEAQFLERLKATPFGAWLQVTNPAPGGHARLRLSWFSTLTGRCLLTSQRGTRVDERGLGQVARDLAADRLRFETPRGEALLDRCWRAVVASLEHAPTPLGDLPLR